MLLSSVITLRFKKYNSSKHNLKVCVELKFQSMKVYTPIQVNHWFTLNSIKILAQFINLKKVQIFTIHIRRKTNGT